MFNSLYYETSFSLKNVIYLCIRVFELYFATIAENQLKQNNMFKTFSFYIYIYTATE